MHPISKRLQQQNAGKPKDLLQARYEAMKEDSFAFYRGTCGIFYEDLFHGVAGKLPDSPLAWVAGDLHMANFGSYRGDTGGVYFDINDFDEASLAPASWDLARLAASIVVWCKCSKVDERNARVAAKHCLDIYATTLASGKARYIESHIAEEEAVRQLLEKAAKEEMEELRKKETEEKDGGQRQFSSSAGNKLKDSERSDLSRHLTRWMKNGRPQLKLTEYKVEDAIFRIAGTGSIGLNRYMFLLHWPHEGPKDYLIMEMKESGPSSLVEFLPHTIKQPSWESEAERIIGVQKRMQAIYPPILEPTLFEGKHYVLQQRQPEKRKIDLTKLGLDDALQIIGCMARLTAYAQLRSAGREGSANADAFIAFGNDYGAWGDAVLHYALEYADVTTEYYKQFLEDLDKIRND